MRRKVATLLTSAFCALSIILSVSGQQGRSSGGGQASVTAFLNVNVIPMDRERVLPNQTVLIKDGRIAEIGDSARIKVPSGAIRIEARGQYLIPGLIDMHSHLFSDDEYPDSMADGELGIMIANGVTTTRIMIGTPEHLVLRDRVANGTLLGPMLYVASPEFTGRPARGIFNGRTVRTPDEARLAVAECKAAGYDFIKLTTNITRAVYDAVMEAAKSQGIRVVGHVDLQVGLQRALEAGQQIEHLDSYMEAVLRDDAPMKVSVSDSGIGRKANWESLDYVDDKKVEEAAKATARAGIYTCPTLTFFNLSYAMPQTDDQLRSRPDFRFFPPKFRDSRFRAHTRFWATPPTDARLSRYIAVRNMLVRKIYEAGGKLMTGSDTPELFLLYGFTLHREIQSLVTAGMKPYAALEAATRNPAEYLRGLDTFGTIEKGKRADLLLLRGNPLEDVTNTERRTGVMVRGKWIPDAQTKVMLDEIAASFEKIWTQ